MIRLAAIFLTLFFSCNTFALPMRPSQRANDWLKDQQRIETQFEEKLSLIRRKEGNPYSEIERRRLLQEVSTLLGRLYKERQDIAALSDRKFERETDEWLSVLQQARSLNDLNLENALDLQSKLSVKK